MPIHTVLRLECISSIAARHGFHWREIWDHPDNEALREALQDPNLLRPGDELVIPESSPGEVELATGQQHKLVVNNLVATLRLRLQDDGEPVTGAYVLEVGGMRRQGELSDEGELEETIPATALRGTLLLVARNEQIDLLLGDLDPPQSPSGAIERLINLGLLAAHDARQARALTPEVRHLLLHVQREEGLELTGELDDDTAEALRRWHGC